MRFAARRDDNEDALRSLARSLGATWVQCGPLDGWVWKGGRWTPVEIKKPELEGRKHEYTAVQKCFLQLCRDRNMRVWTWRTEEDVLRDLGARISA